MNKRLYPIWASLLVLVFFTIRYILSKNYEFLTYVVVLGATIYFIFKSDKFFKYPALARWGFAIWMFLHLAGGSFKIAGVRLYDYILVPLVGEPYNFLRYDQVIHTYCYFVITLFVYSVVLFVAKDKIRTKTAFVLIFLGGIGIGAINEIIEFSTVALFNAKGVGDYFNNSLDLIFNSLGALIAAFYSRKY